MAAEENFTLQTFYSSWKEYQDRLRSTLAPLTAEQLALRAAPDLRSVGENAAHIVSCRAGWFTYTLGEDASAEVKAVASWGGGQPGEPTRSAAELVSALDSTWQLMADCLARWSPADMQQTFPDDWGDGKIVQLSRAWVVWHVLEHDLHHSGELSFTGHARSQGGVHQLSWCVVGVRECGRRGSWPPRGRARRPLAAWYRSAHHDHARHQPQWEHDAQRHRGAGPGGAARV